jgi:hypothetical protein
VRTKVPIIFVFTKFDVLVENIIVEHDDLTDEQAEQKAQGKVNLMKEYIEKAFGGPVTSVTLQSAVHHSTSHN